MPGHRPGAARSQSLSSLQAGACWVQTMEGGSKGCTVPPCRNTSRRSPPAPQGHRHPLPLSPALRPPPDKHTRAFRSGLPASPAQPQPSGLPLPAQCRGDRLTLREGRCSGRPRDVVPAWGLYHPSGLSGSAPEPAQGRCCCGQVSSGVTHGRERQGLQLPRAFLPSIAGPGSTRAGDLKIKRVRVRLSARSTSLLFS